MEVDCLIEELDWLSHTLGYCYIVTSTLAPP